MLTLIISTIAAFIVALAVLAFLSRRNARRERNRIAAERIAQARKAAEQSQADFHARMRAKDAIPYTYVPSGSSRPGVSHSSPAPAPKPFEPVRRHVDDAPSYTPPLMDYSTPSFDLSPSYDTSSSSAPDTSSTDSGSFSSGGGDTNGGGGGSDW